MKQAVIYARVSSREQEREGYSVQAQVKLLRQYAKVQGFDVVHEFVDVETAKAVGRKHFAEMVRFLEGKGGGVVLAEKTDRLYRNYRDYVTLDDLGVEIHLPKEGAVVGKNAKSQANLVHGFHLLIARNYSENLREEVMKGMREKAEQGIFPGYAPFGYRNNKALRTIEIDPEKAPAVQRLFELYSTGRYSISSARQAIDAEFGIRITRSYLGTVLSNPFYMGSFRWQGKLYPGTHEALIRTELFEQVQNVSRRRSQPHPDKHQFAFSGLLRCAYDNCRVTAEAKKRGKYTYYHCTGYRGKCALPYFREEILAERLGTILKDIYVPDEVLTQLTKSLNVDRSREVELVRVKQEGLQQRLSSLRHRIDQAYEDKVEGKISEEFWIRKSAEWQAEEQQIIAHQAPAAPRANRVCDLTRILELANKAHFQYVSQGSTEKGKLLKTVLSNCSVDALSVYPTYRKPFDLIAKRVKTENWSGREDSNLRPPGAEP
jgi:site-specific DNA recombinase